jgi:hypothetical protein
MHRNIFCMVAPDPRPIDRVHQKVLPVSRLPPTHLIRRSPNALGEDGFGPISLSCCADKLAFDISEIHKLTPRKTRLALKTPSMPLNMRSSSGGGKLDLDHAEATF